VGGGSSLHSGIEFGWSRTGKGSSGGEEELKKGGQVPITEQNLPET